MPNAAFYRAQIGENPVESGLNRLTASLIGIHERKLARARQAEMDRIAQEQEARAAQAAEDERQLKLFALKQQLEAAKPRGPSFASTQRAEVAPGKAPMDIPDTPEERAAFAATQPPPTPGPSITFAGETLQAPSASELQARQDEDFARKLVQEGQLAGARAEGGLITVPEGFGELSGKQIPATAFDALIRAQMGGGSTARPFEALFGGKPAMIDPETRQPIPGLEPIPPRAPVGTGVEGLSPTANRNLTGITTKFQADTVMAQAGQGATIKAIADQVLADPKSAPNQLKSLYILVKNLDPTSAVREGELSLAQATQSYQQQWGNVLDRVNQGVVIGPAAAAQLAQATKEIANLWDAAAQRRQKQYQAQAGVLGVGPQFDDYLSRFASPGAAPALAPAAGLAPETKAGIDALFSGGR